MDAACRSTCRGESHELVGHQHPGLPAQQAADAAVQQVPPHVRVHRRQRVVQQHHIGAGVAGPRQGDPLLLASAQVDALLPDLRVVPCKPRQGVKASDLARRIQAAATAPFHIPAA